MNWRLIFHTLKNARTDVHHAIWKMRLAQKEMPGDSDASRDCAEINRVLEQAVAEIDKLLSRGHAARRNSLNHRQAEDLALKAQLAKARQAVADALKDVPTGPSDK